MIVVVQLFVLISLLLCTYIFNYGWKKKQNKSAFNYVRAIPGVNYQVKAALSMSIISEPINQFDLKSRSQVQITFLKRDLFSTFCFAIV